MNEYDPKAVEGIGSRDVRALTEVMTVLEDQGDVRGVPGFYEVVSASGRSYKVDARERSCECPDASYRDIECKHIKRVRYAAGLDELPEWIDVAALDDGFGDHVSTGREVAADGGEVEDSEALADELRGADLEDVDGVLDEHDPTIATDGGAVEATDATVQEAVTGAEILEDDDPDVFEGPFPEYDRYGNPTGEYFKRCRDCSREFLEDTPESAVSHRDGCDHADGADDDSAGDDELLAEAEAVAGGGELVTDGGTDESAGETPDVGDHVVDVQDPDTTLVVVGISGEPADVHEIKDGLTVADVNTEFPANDDVVQVVFPSRESDNLERSKRYSYPASRLRTVATVHDRGGDESDEDDRDEPRRSEPADFGHGESTGVQTL